MSGLLVDINCDMGESFGPYRLGDDESVLSSVSSANIACGFHGGDPRVMDATVAKSVARGVAIGAHPGFPDLVGFGRRDMKLSFTEAYTDVLYQIGALDAFCRRHGTRLQHVKPHGQLNNLACHDGELAEAIARAVADYDKNLILVAYCDLFVQAAEKAGLTVAHEIFADREYNADGTLVSRRLDHAVIRDPQHVVERAVRMVREGRVQAMDESIVPLKVHTICVHGDTPGAANLAAMLRVAFSEAGIGIAPMAHVLANQP